MRQALRAAKKRVLIVDDDEQVRDIASLFVEELGYPVSTASTPSRHCESFNKTEQWTSCSPI